MTGVTRYEKLQNLLRDKIQSGNYAPGDRFFSQNELMEKYGLSLSTVTKALDSLVQDGFLARQQGRGTFVKAVEPVQSSAPSAPRNIYVFAPWDAQYPALNNLPLLCQELEVQCPPHYQLRLTPHLTGPDDLEPFLFAKNPIDYAVFYYPVSAHDNFIGRLAEEIPTIVLADSPRTVNGVTIQTSAAAAAQLATEHLLSHGHIHIAVVGAVKSSTRSNDFLDGYRTALRGAGFAYPNYVATTDVGNIVASPGLLDIISQSTQVQPTAVIALGSAVAVKLLTDLRVLGKRIPADISVVCFDDMEKAGLFPHPLTTVHYSTRRVAMEIMDVLAQASEKGGFEVKPVSPVLTSRDSTSPLLSVQETAQNKTSFESYK